MVRVGESRRESDSVVILFISTEKYSSEDEFKRFSKCVPFSHFVIQRSRAGLCTRWKIQFFSLVRSSYL